MGDQDNDLLGRLEDVLAPTRRMGGGTARHTVSLPESRDELLTEAKKLAGRVTKFSKGELSTRQGGTNWVCNQSGNFDKSGEKMYNTRYRRQDRVNDKDVPIEVLQGMVINGRNRTAEYDRILDEAISFMPESALESMLDGESGIDVLKGLVNRKTKKLEDEVGAAINLPKGVTMSLSRVCRAEGMDDSTTAHISIGKHGYGSANVSFSDMPYYPSNLVEARRLASFAMNFDKLAEMVMTAVHGIRIK